MNLENMTFTMACNKVFGRKHGQTLADFNKELKELDENDRAYFIEHFKAVGIDATKQSTNL